MYLKKKKPVRDNKYLAFIRGLPCVLCRDRYVDVDAHHIKTHGMGTKGDDDMTVPVCRLHHAEIHSFGQSIFEIRHKISFKNLISIYQTAYKKGKS
jgi:hypothetical protein